MVWPLFNRSGQISGPPFLALEKEGKLGESQMATKTSAKAAPAKKTTAKKPTAKKTK